MSNREIDHAADVLVLGRDSDGRRADDRQHRADSATCSSGGSDNGSLQHGDHIVLVAGIGLASKGHNMVRVHTVGQAAG